MFRDCREDELPHGAAQSSWSKRSKFFVHLVRSPDKLLKLSTAERAQLRNVLLHAFRDLFDVGNELSAEFHGVRSAGPTLFWRSFRETGG
jgi:hypothetical protein